MPADTPVTTPVPELIVALEVNMLDHTPLPGVAPKAVVLPTHTDAVPVIAPGANDTVTTLVVKQPVANWYVIVLVPASTPVTTPAILTVATAGVLLLQTPPPVELEKVVVEPTQTVGVPEMLLGNGLTVTTILWVHAPVREYEILTVPDDTPVTMPLAEPTVALPTFALDQVPPAVTCASVVLLPGHTTLVPVIAGTVLTVATAVVLHPVLV